MTDDFDFFDVEAERPVRQVNPRLGAEWVTVNAIREMLGIALKGSASPTYEQALTLGATLLPELLGMDSSLLVQGQEAPAVREYRQRAEAQAQLKGKKISPVEIIDAEIQEFTELVNTKGTTDQLQRKLFSLEKIRSLLIPKNYTENQLILRDVFKAERAIPGPPIEGDTYRDYRLPNGRGLRIRMLHPDPPEHSVGADLIYEMYWEKKRLVRLTVVQYKLWNGEKLLLSQARNLEDQIVKLQAALCNNGLCNAHNGSPRAEAYRLPFCSAFLRPTDELQSSDSRLISSGLHIPICAVLKSIEDTGFGGKKIERKRIRSEALSHKVFEELFNTNMLGSKWLTYDEAEKLYQEHKILRSDERIVIHTQEFGFS